jgi:hypothetical protein
MLVDFPVYCTSIHSYICIIAPHLGTLAVAREGLDVEPNPKMELVDSSRRWKDRTSARMRECSPSEFLLTYSNLSRIPGKPRSIISLLSSKQLIIYTCYKYCCIKW